ncbi:BNR-4 repeat-containing protein [Membranihabitans marinus]|uniref:BNR-4 repeat-containing protein n=1 Tax=Membranihabitans marinus TaxID=1227546 RepID=UPI001F33A6E0|nr:BNR-4 repeat-containing protein [Membranihabitans marinus]
MNRSNILLVLLVFVSCFNLHAQEVKTLTEDGAWCWFSDPRAIFAGDDGMVFTGWVTSKGDIEVASLDVESGEVKTKNLYPKMQIDDHDNPAFVELPDQRIMTMFTWHGGDNGVVQNTTMKPMELNSFGENVILKPYTDKLVEEYVKLSYTYANPMRLSEEKDRIYAFGRWIGYKPNMIYSDNNGSTWSNPSIVITSKDLDTNNRPYVKYFSDGKSKIHMIFTDGHPAVEPLNSVYYCYYEAGAFWRADNSKICDVENLPFHPEDATVVYKATMETGRAWIFDVAIDKKDRPVIAYSRYPRVKTHNYHYAVYDDGQWIDHKIVYSGTWFPEDVHGQRQRELNYSGGLTLDPMDPSTLYFSHNVDGVFEISRGKTSNDGKSWKFKSITKNSTKDNVRPFVPRYRKKGQKNILMWMENNHYIHFTDYHSSIKYTKIR